MGKPELKEVKPVVWSHLAQHWQPDCRDHASDYSVGSSFGYYVPGTKGFHGKQGNMIPDLRSCQSASQPPSGPVHATPSGCKALPTVLCQPSGFLHTLKTKMRHHLPQLFFTAWGVAASVSPRCSRAQAVLLSGEESRFRQTWLKFWFLNFQTLSCWVGYFSSPDLSFCMCEMGLLQGWNEMMRAKQFGTCIVSA